MQNSVDLSVAPRGGTILSPAAHPMADWLATDSDFREFQRGDLVDGTIVSVAPGEILVDIGGKTEAFVSDREIERMSPDALEALRVGAPVRAVVITPEDKNGNVVLSLAQAELNRDWELAERLHASGEIFESTISNHNKGGVIVTLGKVRGFVPASQLTRARRKNAGPANQPNSLASLVGQTLWLKVIEVDRAHNRLILSEVAAMRQRNKEEKERLLSELKEGDIVCGEVISLADFGAFVHLGGADGLIHLSELSWRRVNHPSEVLKVGEKIKVYVLSVDREKRRIALSLKRLQPEPWSVVDERYKIGQLVEGTITKLASFGAFARVDGELEGLIHISELSENNIQHPQEVVQENQTLLLRIIRIDSARRRMGLSLKRVANSAYSEAEMDAEVLPQNGIAEGLGETDRKISI